MAGSVLGTLPFIAAGSLQQHPPNSQKPTEQAAEPGRKQRPLRFPGIRECAGGKMFLEHNGYVGRLPAPMSTWRHSGKGELCGQLKGQRLPGAGERRHAVEHETMQTSE